MSEELYIGIAILSGLIAISLGIRQIWIALLAPFKLVQKAKDKEQDTAIQQLKEKVIAIEANYKALIQRTNDIEKEFVAINKDIGSILNSIKNIEEIMKKHGKKL